MPKYMQRPKAAAVAITADTLPSNPSHGFDLTTSPIIQVIMLLDKIKLIRNSMTIQMIIGSMKLLILPKDCH